MAPLRTLLVGCKGVGIAHASCAASLPADFTIVGLCDIDPAARAEASKHFPAATASADLADLLRTLKPDVAIVATSETPRARIALQCLEAGVRGLYVEKPIAVSYGEAKAMAEAAAARGAPLCVNHQRRTMPVFHTMRRLIESGAIGEVSLIRAACAGDVVSDGTHLVDTVRHLYGDARAKWLAGFVYRRDDGPSWKGEGHFPGVRFGHTVERGAFALVEFENRRRAEFHTGRLQIQGAQYQCYEVYGSKGRLLRNGDSANPPLLIQDDQPGGWRPVPLEEPPGWVPVKSLAFPMNYALFARQVREGRDAVAHPLDVRIALHTHEIVCAVYESGRTHDKIEFPLRQDAWPLDLLIGELGQPREFPQPATP